MLTVEFRNHQYRYDSDAEFLTNAVGIPAPAVRNPTLKDDGLTGSQYCTQYATVGFHRSGAGTQGLRITIAKLGYMGSFVSRTNSNFCRTVLRLSDSVVTNTAALLFTFNHMNILYFP